MSELFLGWITVVTAANIAVVVVSTPLLTNIGVFSPVIWTIIGLGIATAVHIWVAVRYRTYVPGLVLIWALVANMVAHNNMPVYAFVVDPWIYVEDFDQYMLLLQGLIAPGMSGGGAFTEDGVFVGILCGGDEEGKVAVVPYSMIETERP